ncbi:hypothetical protein GALMADRAFT_73791 [Galerina marginata CBS 339.88]|uniref:Exocyst complex component SEC5 n=1 Tax=Galerina marginata (strain CBS 339.88) TaxID=685588 RepID=A0A067SP11_GALM3|nr:hypothetical protein GALMADRAFT_73791 [Galerina marginata CBS 339.88]
MPRLNFNVDEATLLKAYKISTLHPTRWEEVDHDFDESIASATSMASGGVGVGQEREREKEDPLGLGPAKSVKDLDMENKSSLVLTSKTFSPALYLAFAHPNATYPDLARGIAHLQTAIEAREEALRGLVEEGFDKFVSVKSAVDGLYVDMRQAILAPETEHATKPLRDHLKYGAQKANQIFLPVLETASKAQKLRTTLSIFERSRFFFNLPSFIMESIDAGKYELALRDYKKGKYLLENRPGQLLPISLSGSPLSSQATQASIGAPQEQQQHMQQLEQQQKRILNKVWASVEKAMGEMRRVLVAQLQDSTRSVEEQEKTLETLLELHTNDEPVWTYFDSHHTHIMDRMSAAYRAGIKAIDSQSRLSASASYSADGPDASLDSQFCIAIARLESKQADVILAQSSAGEPAWKAILGMVKSVSDAVSSALPSFWTVSKSFIDGKYRRPTTNNSGTRRSPSQCRTMAYDIVKLYISLISQAFMLSDVSVMSRSQSSNYDPPPLVPVNSHSFCSAYYLQRTLSEVQECAADLGALDISNEATSGLRSLVESLRWRVVDVLVHEWVRDARMFYHLETWTAMGLDEPNPRISRPGSATTTTRLLFQFELFQKHMTTTAYKMAATAVDLPLAKGSSSSSSRQGAGIQQVLSTKVTRGFIDAVYQFMDGLMVLVSDDAPPVVEHVGVGAGESARVEGVSAVGTSLGELLDLKDPSTRLLLVIANLDHFGKAVLPGMVTQLENAFGVSLAEDRITMNGVVGELDKTLFEAYTKPRAAVIKEHIQRAVPGSEVDWYRAQQPVGVRPWVPEIMNYIVEVHGQLCNATPSLLDRTVVALIDDMAKEASNAFGKITRFGTGGLLLAVMELTFIHKSLGHYGRETVAGRAIEDIYTKEITQAYAPSPRDNDFQASFDAMQRTLAEARRATGVQFLCFRKVKEKDPGEKEASAKEKTRARNKNKE